jgi:hypothetical protein
MMSDVLPETTVLAQDIMLLAQPHIQAPALAYLSAGTAIRPLRSVDGFFAIQHEQHYGFLPTLLCLLSTTPAPYALGSRLTLEQPALLWSSLAASTAPSPPISAAAGEQLLVLGHDDGWLFVQRRDGQIGFLAPTQVAAQEERRVGPRVGCMLATLWIGTGWGWASMNWFAVQSLLLPVIFSPRWQARLAWLIALGVLIAMWRGPRRDPERIFLVGVFFHLVVMFLALLTNL